MVTRSMFPGTLTLGSAPGGGVALMTLTSVMFNRKDSSASGSSSYKVFIVIIMHKNYNYLTTGTGTLLLFF